MPTKHTNEELRAHLFETLERLKNGDMTPAEGRAIVDVGNAIIASARLEIDLAKAISSDKVPTAFFEIEPEDVPDSRLPKRLTESRELPEKFKPQVRPGSLGSDSLHTPPSLNIVPARTASK